MTAKEISNLRLLEDSNKGFRTAINRGNYELAKIYLIDIINRTNSLIDQNNELEYLGYSSVLEYIDVGGNLTCVNFDVYCDYRDFLCELKGLID